jgi:hypothetical protein
VPRDGSGRWEPLQSLSAMGQGPPFSLVLVDPEAAPTYLNLSAVLPQLRLDHCLTNVARQFDEFYGDSEILQSLSRPRSRSWLEWCRS